MTASTVSQGTRTAVEERIDLLLRQLNTAQKLSLMHGAAAGPYAGRVPGVPTIGIPPLLFEDGPAGIRDGFSLALPAPIALASTWDPGLAREYGDVLARDAIAKGANGILGPSLDVARVYANGRTFEGLGEEPWLTSKLAVPEIRAIQNDHVIAVVKHYVAYAQQNGAHRDAAIVDDRTLREVYVAPFAAAFKDGHAGGVMCSYNRIGDAWSCENAKTLRILRHELGFNGFVVSDWYAQHDIYRSLFNGLDLEMPLGVIYGDYLTGAVARGNAPITVIDDHVRNILRGMMDAGLVDGMPSTKLPSRASDLKIARHIADDGAVLLKNERGVLPIDPERRQSIAVIGPVLGSAVVAGGGSSLVRYDPANSPSIVAAIRSIARKREVSVAETGGPPFVDDVPTVDTLSLSPPNGRGSGLVGSYYASPDLKGRPLRKRLDRSVWFQWGTSPPMPGLPLNGSVRWNGWLRAPVTGTYRMGGDGRCLCRLRIGGALVQDAWNLGSSQKAKLGTIRLRAGTRYPLVFEWRFGGDGNVRLAWAPPPCFASADLANAIRVARHADYAIVFAGDFSTEGADRSSLRLSDFQERLIRSIGEVNSRTIVVLEDGGPIVATPWINSAAAVMELWYPGEAGGLVAADLLFGAVNPSGKLPVSFPRKESDVPAIVRWGSEPALGPPRQINFSERLDVGYRWYDAKGLAPLFPFGFGLSYSSFTFRNLSVHNLRLGYRVAVDVTNLGSRAGKTVLEIYVGFPASVGEPPYILRGFVKLELRPDETKRPHIDLPVSAFQYWSERSGTMQVAPGKYTILAGASSRDLPLSTTIVLP